MTDKPPTAERDKRAIRIWNGCVLDKGYTPGHVADEIRAAEAQAREPLEQEIELREESRQRIEKVLLYVLFVLTGSEEVKTDLCDSVQMAADNTKRERDALRGDADHWKTCHDGACRCVETLHAEVRRLRQAVSDQFNQKCDIEREKVGVREAARREGAREALGRAAETVENPLASLLPPKDVAAAIRALGEGEESDD